MNKQQAINKTIKAIKEYNLIESGDKVAIGVSGGKDSIFMLHMLSAISKFYEPQFSVKAFCVNMHTPGMNLCAIEKYCAKNKIDLEVIDSEIYDIVFNIRKEKNPCSLCAKMRRGILCSVASQQGYNKLALGHNANDLNETLFLSMLHEGRLSTLAPKAYLSNTKITVIRPILLFTEQEVKTYATVHHLPITQNLCPANHHTQREKIKTLLAETESTFPGSSQNITNAIISPDRYNLFPKTK